MGGKVKFYIPIMSTTQSKTRLPSIGRPPSQFSNNANFFGNGGNTNAATSRTPSLHKGSDGMKDNIIEENEQGEAQDDLEMYVTHIFPGDGDTVSDAVCVCVCVCWVLFNVSVNAHMSTCS